MAKKARNPRHVVRPPGKASPPPQDAETTESEEDEAAPTPTLTMVRPRSSGVSPLVRSQEVELEVGLTVLGTVVGVLTGYGQNLPLDAVSGNLVGAVEGGLVGALMGYSLGRTLFLSVRAQWISWVVLVALAYVGYLIGALPGADVGAIIGTGLVLSGAFGRDDDDLEEAAVLPSTPSPSPSDANQTPFLPRQGNPSYPAPPRKLGGK